MIFWASIFQYCWLRFSNNKNERSSKKKSTLASKLQWITILPQNRNRRPNKNRRSLKSTPQVRRPQPVLLARSQQIFDVDDRHGRLLPRPRRLRPRDRPHGTVHVGRQRQGQCSTTGSIGYSDIAGKSVTLKNYWIFNMRFFLVTKNSLMVTITGVIVTEKACIFITFFSKLSIVLGGNKYN